MDLLNLHHSKTSIKLVQFYPIANVVGNFIIFNIKGSSYRLTLSIYYGIQTVDYEYFLTYSD
ncbi:type II toxin-antitoxin system HigB family toxin [Trichormus azollae]|uniref:type II toxin-antitoxin system HigB family toxin n=1 Tax=Trichormus azollae TaxID=1164 RepID=UPI003D337856